MSEAPVIRIESWLQLQEEVLADAYVPEWNRWRSPHAFRGLSDAAYKLTNSLTRMGRQYPELEPSLLRNFKKYAPRAVVEQDSVWHWLTMGQHHGLPSRLLDWSWSPLVAVHFATQKLENYGADGVIWAVNVLKVKEELPHELRELIEGTAFVFDVNLLSSKVPDLESLCHLSKKDYLVFFEPPSIDERVVNQYALHSVMDDPNRALDDWLESRPHLYRKLVIPAALKWEIRDKLDQINVNERVLFPGLDGLSAWLRRNYYSR